MSEPEKKKHQSFRLEPSLKGDFAKLCNERRLKDTEVMRLLILHFLNNPKMKFDI